MNINPQLINTLGKEKDPSKLMGKLTPEEKQTVNKMLQDKNALAEMLKSPEAQAIMKILSGKGKNG